MLRPTALPESTLWLALEGIETSRQLTLRHTRETMRRHMDVTRLAGLGGDDVLVVEPRGPLAPAA